MCIQTLCIYMYCYSQKEALYPYFFPTFNLSRTHHFYQRFVYEIVDHKYKKKITHTHLIQLGASANVFTERRDFIVVISINTNSL